MAKAPAKAPVKKKEVPAPTLPCPQCGGTGCDFCMGRGKVYDKNERLEESLKKIA